MRTVPLGLSICTSEDRRRGAITLHRECVLQAEKLGPRVVRLGTAKRNNLCLVAVLRERLDRTTDVIVAQQEDIGHNVPGLRAKAEQCLGTTPEAIDDAQPVRLLHRIMQTKRDREMASISEHTHDPAAPLEPLGLSADPGDGLDIPRPTSFIRHAELSFLRCASSTRDVAPLSRPRTRGHHPATQLNPPRNPSHDGKELPPRDQSPENSTH